MPSATEHLTGLVGGGEEYRRYIETNTEIATSAEPVTYADTTTITDRYHIPSPGIRRLDQRDERGCFLRLNYQHLEAGTMWSKA
jgi:hypothetical protein